MRMWMVDPKLLCKRHLLGEHFEIHLHRHNFVKRHSMAGRNGQIEPENMEQRHDELAAEMLRRGYNHKSPFEQPDISHLSNRSKVDVQKSLDDLSNRCQDCRGRIEDV